MSAETIRYPDWVFRQSAVLPYRQGRAGLEVLLITSRKGKRWVLPKGIVEPGLTATQSAAKEAREEAGVEGPVGPQSLGRYEQRKWGGTCGVEVFPMEVRRELTDWPEAGMRRRQWRSVADAAAEVDAKKLRRIILRLPETVSAERLIKASMACRAHLGVEPPAKLIYLLRHGKSATPKPALTDFDRPLSKGGRRALGKTWEYMRLADVEPDFVLCSSALRTRQTLEIVRSAIANENLPVKFDRGLYGLGQKGLLNRLRRTPDDKASVLLIGHNPGIQALAVELCGSGDVDTRARLAEKFPPGALAILTWPGAHWTDLTPASCGLHSLVGPGDL